MNSYTQKEIEETKHVMNTERTIIHNGEKAISVTFTFYEPIDLDMARSIIPKRIIKTKQNNSGVKTVKGSQGKTFKV